MPEARRRAISKDAHEGFCELLAYLLMADLQEQGAQATIVNNAYTRGQFPLLLQAQQKYGLSDVVDWVKYGVDSKLQAGALDRVRNVQMPKVAAAGRVGPTVATPVAIPSQPETPPEQALAVKSIFYSTTRPLALINGRSIAPKEAAKIKYGRTNLTVRCLSIRTNSVRVHIAETGDVAYWILEKEAHSQAFKANLRHITQAVLELYKKKDKLFLKALKLVGRPSREAFKPHAYEIEGSNILIVPAKKDLAFDIGSKIRDARIKLGMSQKDLADKIGLTSSFISQIENNQISPSLNSFMQIAGALNIKPTALLQSDKKKDELKWLIKARSVRENLIEKSPEYSVFSVVSDAKLSAYIIIVNKAAQLNRHFFLQKKDELIYILKGTVTVVIESREKDLKAGDSLYLKDSLPVSWCNNSYEEAELFVVCC